MKTRQVSVFVANRAGRLASVARVLRARVTVLAGDDLWAVDDGATEASR